jgi:hypothetical protein
MRENRTCGSEGGEGVSPSRPLSSRLDESSLRVTPAERPHRLSDDGSNGGGQDGFDLRALIDVAHVNAG